MLTKYKSKSSADKDYKEYMLMAKASWALNDEPM
jgi:hypothetical protein